MYENVRADFRRCSRQHFAARYRRQLEVQVVHAELEIRDNVHPETEAVTWARSERIESGAAGHHVVAATAVDHVVAVATTQHVVAGPAADEVRTVATDDRIVAVVAVQTVVTSEAVDRIVARLAINDVRAARPADRIVARRTDELSKLDVHVRQIGNRYAVHLNRVQRIDAQQHTGRIRHGSRKNRVETRELGHLAQIQHVLADRKVRDDVRPEIRRVEPSPSKRKHVETDPARQDVVVFAAIEGIVAGTTIDGVVSGSGVDDVVACTTAQRVIAAVAPERIVLGAAGDAVGEIGPGDVLDTT